MKMRLMMVGTAAMLMLGGCATLPSPGETIQAPAVESPQNQAAVQDPMKDIKQQLPDGAKVVISKHSGAKEIQMQDLNGDGQEEALVVYEETVQDQKKLKAVVLEQVDEAWEIAWETDSPGYELDYAGFADLTGDGQDEILLGWTIGASAGSGLDIYTWNNHSAELLANSGYNGTLDIEDMPSAEGKDGKAEIAVWQRDLATAFKVDVLRWDGENLVPAMDVYPYYFKKVAQYYNEQLAASGSDPQFKRLLYYYLADAQVKSGNLDEAKISIKNGLKAEGEHPSKETFDALLNQ